MKYTNDYSLVAESRGQRVLKYQTFGSYQGEWLMVSRDAKNYYIYKDSYGSCSGCDSLDAFGYDDETTEDQIKDFAANYEPFIAVPRDTFARLMKEKKLIDLMPANILDGYDINKETVQIFLDELESEEKIALKELKQ